MILEKAGYTPVRGISNSFITERVCPHCKYIFRYPNPSILLHKDKNTHLRQLMRLINEHIVDCGRYSQEYDDANI